MILVKEKDQYESKVSLKASEYRRRDIALGPHPVFDIIVTRGASSLSDLTSIADLHLMERHIDSANATSAVKRCKCSLCKCP